MLIENATNQSVRTLRLREKVARLSDKTLSAVLKRYERLNRVDEWYCLCCEESERRKEFYYRQYTLFD